MSQTKPTHFQLCGANYSSSTSSSNKLVSAQAGTVLPFLRQAMGSYPIMQWGLTLFYFLLKKFSSRILFASTHAIHHIDNGSLDAFPGLRESRLHIRL